MFSNVAQGLAASGVMSQVSKLQRPVDATATSSVLDQIKDDAKDKLAIEDAKKNANKVVDGARFCTSLFAH
jgi:hypothetical protein